MRLFFFSSAIILSLFLSHTAVMAQDKLDEFQAFRNKLGAEKGVGSPDDEESALKPSNTGENVADTPKNELTDAVIADSKIKAVTVYSDRAKIIRVAEVDVPSGAQTVVFKDMPSSLISETLRVEGSAKADVKLGAVSSKSVILKKTSTNPRAASINDEIKKLGDQIGRIQLLNQSLDAQKQFLETVSHQPAPANSDRTVEYSLKPEQWISMSKSLNDEVAAILTSQYDNSLKIRDIQEQIQQKNAELSEMRPTTTSTFAVMVPVDCDKPTHLSLELSYQIPNATWYPIYDARLSTADKGGLELVQYGNVRQRTGEDWTNVSLTLSTAQPQKNAELLDILPWWIDSYGKSSGGFFGSDSVTNNSGVSGINAGGVRNQIGRSNDVDKVYTEAIEKENEMRAKESSDPLQEWRAKHDENKPAEFVAAIVESGGFVNEYKIIGPSTVPSDNTETKLLVGKFDAESKIAVHLQPKTNNVAVLVAHTKLKGEAPLLSGPVSLFRDGAYIGQAMLPFLRPDEEHELSFGIDDQVSVKRNTLKNQNKEEGLISKNNVSERQYITEIQNLHSFPVQMVVKENIPAPRNDKIVVDISPTLTTAGYKKDAENITGLLKWEFQMAPKEKKEIKLSWSVNWPDDQYITGLQ